MNRETIPAARPRKRWNQLLRTMALLSTSILFSLFLGEVIVRVAIPVRNVGPTFSEFDPLYGKRLKKSFSCTRVAPEFTMKFTTNSLGFRGEEPPSFPRNGILFLGDSFTSGYGVNDGEEFPALLGDALKQRLGEEAPPIVNAGTGNTGNGYWLRFLRKEVDRFSPRMIVYGFCVNDFLDNAIEQFFILGSDGTLRDSELPPPQETARSAQRVIEAVPGLAYSHLVGLARQLFSEHGTPPPPAQGQSSGDTLTYAILRQVFAFSSGRGIPAVLVVMGVDTTREEHLFDIARKFGVHCVHAPTKREQPELYYTVDGHWNATGHAFIARRLLPVIQEIAALSPEGVYSQ